MGGGSLPQTITFQQNPLRTFNDPGGYFPIFTKESFDQWILDISNSGIPEDSGFTEASLNYLVRFDSPWQVIGSNVLKDLSNIDISNGQSLTDIFDHKEALTDICGSAFQNMGLTGGLDFSGFSALETICSNAFGNNPNVTSVNLKNNALKTIGNSAFIETGLTELDLSGLNTLETIGDSAFYDRPLDPLNLKGLTNLKTIGDSAFEIVTGGYSSPLISNLSELTNLESIGSFAFGGVSIGALEISGLNSLKTIGSNAFYGTGNQIYDVLLQDLPDLSSIGNSAFTDQPIFDISIINCPSLNQIGNDCFKTPNLVDHSSNNLTLRGVPSLTSFPHQAFNTASFEGSLELTNTGFTAITDDFSNGSFMGSLKINDNKDLSSISENAFYDNSFTSLELSGNPALTKIEKGTFSLNNFVNGVVLSNCSNLQVIEGTGPNEEGAFSNSNITSLTFNELPKLISIGTGANTTGAFENNSISSIDFTKLESLQTIGKHAFNKAIINQELNFSGLLFLKDIDDFAFKDNSLNSQVKIENCPSLQNIGEQAFQSSKITGRLDFSGLTSLGTIDNLAFHNNNLNDRVTFTNCPSLQLINPGAFNEAGISGELDLSELDSLIQIKSDAFKDNSLNYVNFGNISSLVNIALDAFLNAGIKGTLTLEGLPELISIEGETYPFSTNGAFKNNSITDITIIDCSKLQNIQESVFLGNPLSGSITLRNLPSINLFPNGMNVNTFKGSLELTKTGLTEITNDFSNGSFAGSLTINDNQDLSSINTDAFYDNSFTSLELSGNPSLTILKGGSFSNNDFTNGVVFTNCPSLTTIESTAFYKSSISGPLDFKPLIGLESLGASGDISGAFELNPSITTIDFSGLSSLEIIGNRAFSKLDSGNFFELVNFSNCPSLQVIKTKAFETSNITDTTIVTFKDNSGLVVEAGAFNAAGNFTSNPGGLPWNDPSNNSLTIPDDGLYVFDFDPSP